MSRPLNEEELANGLTAVTINGKYLEEIEDLTEKNLLYSLPRIAQYQSRKFF